MNVIRTRRDFFKLSAASLAALAGGLYFPDVFTEPYDQSAFTAGMAGKGREYIALCGGPKEESKMNLNPAYDPGLGSMFVFDVATGDRIEIPLPCGGHTVNQNPLRPHHLVTFEKWGKHGALVDLKDRKVLAVADAADGAAFFGHCVFSADGTQLMTTEGDPDVQQGKPVTMMQNGKLVLRDASTLQAIRTMDAYGMSPHECRSPDGGKTLVVINGGYGASAPNLSWIDFQSGKLLKQIELGMPRHVSFTHFDLSADGWVCAGGVSHKDEDNLIAFVSPDGQVLPPAIPGDVLPRVRVLALSIAFLGRDDLVAVTIPPTSTMLIFDYKKQSLVEVVDISHPKGVLPAVSNSRTEANWLVSLAKGSMAAIAETQGLRTKTRIVDSSHSVYNAHMTRFYI